MPHNLISINATRMVRPRDTGSQLSSFLNPNHNITNRESKLSETPTISSLYFYVCTVYCTGYCNLRFSKTAKLKHSKNIRLFRRSKLVYLEDRFGAAPELGLGSWRLRGRGTASTVFAPHALCESSLCYCHVGTFLACVWLDAAATTLLGLSAASPIWIA